MGYQPFYENVVDGNGIERTVLTVDGLKVAPNKASAWSTDATGRVTGMVFSTLVKFPDGSSSAPSITFASNPFDGFYWLSSGNIVFTSNASPLVRFGQGSGMTLGSGAQLGFCTTANPNGTVGSFLTSGTGTPEGAVTAPVGSMFLRQDGGAATSHYVKESGTGNTGWVAK